MKFLFIFLTAISFLAFANDTNMSPNLIYSFSETSGYTYFLSKQQIRPGYSAKLVASGNFVGSVITPNKSEFDTNEKLKKIFEDLLESDKKNLENLSKIKEEITVKVQETKSLATQPVPAQTPSIYPAAAKLDWNSYTSCAKKIIPFLKQSIFLLHKSKTDSSVLPSYYLTKSLVDELSDQNGVACGQYLGAGLELQLSSHIANVKVLTAFLKRTGDERKILLQTLIGAFSKKAPEISANQFAYYFARQFFVASVTTEKIPSYVTLNRELKSVKKTQSYTSPPTAIPLNVEVVTRYTNIDKNYHLGMIFVRGILK